MSESELLMQASAVAIAGRALLIEGRPGSGKSSLALALIDRGATLIGDDGVRLVKEGPQLLACPPPNITGKLEIRGVGIVELPCCSAPVGLILALGKSSERVPERLETRELLGCAIPVLPFAREDPIQPLRAEWALRQHGIQWA